MTAENFLILYGSQTGNAEQIAKDLQLEAASRGYKNVQCAAMNDYEKVRGRWPAA